MFKLEKLEENVYILPRHNKMKVDALLFLKEEILEDVKRDESLKQLADAACLPGVFKHVVGMPDIHSGFGLPIGGVMATDVLTGVVSAGAVGMDINCGVRLLRTNIDRKEMDKTLLRRLMESIEKRVPTGIGKSSRHVKKGALVEEVILKGAKALIDKGLGWPEDRGAIEEEGCLQGADLNKLSPSALKRSDQLATIGGGNHFIEIGYVSEIFNEPLAEFFDLKKGQVTVMIHTGSRGFGHQICTDFTKTMLSAGKKYGIDLPSRGLACVPVESMEGKDYLSAMACAVNFAFGNRQLITHEVRESFGDVYRCSPDDLGLELIYDLAHNIAKFETHFNKKVLVHRKGATRALPPGHPSNPERYLKTGHPVLIPGSMGTASYVVAGTEKNNITFYSANHGAGRVMSRKAARQTLCKKELEEQMKNILTNTRNYKRLLDEAPLSYKNIHQVVTSLSEIDLTRLVARLKPLAVIKGEGD